MGLFLTFLLVLFVSSSFTHEDDGECTCNTIDKSALVVETPSYTCSEMLQGFAEACGNFIECALSYSKPMCLCAACYEEYDAVTEHYKVITNYSVQKDLSDREKQCKDLLLKDDGVGVVKNSHHLVLSLWKNANCKCKLYSIDYIRVLA